MKKIIIILIALISLGFYANAQNSKPTVVVKSSYYPDATNIIITELVKSEKYVVVDISLLEEKIKEKGFKGSWEADSPIRECAKILGIEKIIEIKTAPMQAICRIIDVESGVIEKAILVKDSFYKNKWKEKKNYWDDLPTEKVAMEIVYQLLDGVK
jgi:hypothetical protein